MATSTQLAQALALKKQNPNLTTQEAVLQTKQATTPTPIGGATLPIAPTVTPEVSPTVTPPVQPPTETPQPVIPPQSIAPVQPVAPNTPPPTQNVTPVTPTQKPTTPKVEQPIDFNQGLGREQDINNNLNSFYSQGITSPEEIKKSSGYDTADQNKKNIIDSFITAKAPNADALFSSISTRQVVPESVKLTPAYKQAQNRYNRVNMYSSMTPSQVSTAMDNGKIIEGSQTWEDLKVQNPKLAQDVQNLRIVNGSKTNLYTVNPDGTKTNNLQKTYEEQFMEDYSDLFKVQSVADIIAQVKTADVVEAETKANKYEDEMNALEADIAKIDKDVEAELKGSGATGSRARLEKSVRRDKLNNDLQALNKLYTTQANRANQLITQNATALQTQMSQQQARNSAIGGVMMEGYKNQMALKQNQAEFDQKIAQQAQAMNDPVQAISTMVEEYKKLGIIPPKNLQTLIEEFKKSGKPLSAFLSTLQSDIQNTEEYKAYKAKQSGTEWQSTNITRYNPSTGANESTPIFYRKKTSGGFEAVDLAGNPIDVSTIGGGGGGTPTPGTLPTSFTGDTTSYIASKEGFRDTAYQDSGGVWTIGYGTTSINGKPVQPGQKITQAEAQKQLEADIAKHSNWKNYIDESILSPSQKTALASFEYNLGPGIWDKGAVNIIDMIKSGDLQGAAKEMQKYNTVKGTPIKGLTNRRNEEASLLLNTGEKTTSGFDSAKSGEYENYFKGQLPAGMKKGTIPYDNFIKEAEAYRETVKGKMTPDQLSIYNSQVGRFTSNPAIKSFEEQYTATQNAVTSLGANSGAGDIAGVYQFMKTLDPTSTVREGEFNTAASSAGVIAKLGNAFTKLENGEILSDSQKEAFKSLMIQYLKNKSTQYDRIYEDMIRPLKNAGIDESNFPTRATLTTNTPVSTSQNGYVTPVKGLTGSNGKDYSSLFVK